MGHGDSTLPRREKLSKGYQDGCLSARRKKLCSVMRRRSSAPFSRDLTLERRLTNRAKILSSMSSPLLGFKGNTFQMEFSWLSRSYNNLEAEKIRGGMC